jgi:hypothetical protein
VCSRRNGFGKSADGLHFLGRILSAKALEKTMGMFDDIQCRVVLPVELPFEHRRLWFQTKSLNCEMGFYKISENGYLWKRVRSTTQVNAAVIWKIQNDFIGEIRFYTSDVIIDGEHKARWLEFSTYFIRGELKHIELITFERTFGNHDQRTINTGG